MTKSIWIFLLAVLLPSAVLGWLALRSAEEQQIVFERRTAELYQKETEALAVTVREAVESERRVFGETVHRLLANGDAEALAHDFSNTLADAWPQKAIGFALDKDGKLVSPTAVSAVRNPVWGKFLLDNGSFLCSSEPATVYAVSNDTGNRAGGGYARLKMTGNIGWQAAQAARDGELKLKSEMDAAPVPAANAPAQPIADAIPQPTPGAAPGITQSDFGNIERAPQPAPTAAPATKSDPGGLQFAKGQVGAPDGPVQHSMPRVATVDKLGVDGEQLKKQIQPALEGTGGGKVLEMDSKNKAAAGAAASSLGVTRKANEAPSALADTPAASSPAPSKPTAPAPAKSAQFGLAMKDANDRRAALKERELLMERQEKQSQYGSAETAKAMPGAPPAQQAGAVGKDESSLRKRDDQQKPMENDGTQTLNQAAKITLNRQVEPQQLLGAPSNALSMLVPATAEFRNITEEGEEGIVSRFVQDKLNLIFWLRPPEAPDMIFGCLIEAGNFGELWKGVLNRHLASSRSSYEGSEGQPGFVMALLDDRGHPAATRPAGANAREWKRPFVASEIGEALPHWEAALYLASPTALADSARGLWRTLAFTIAGAVALIALGGWLVVADARRQLALAQQKTDFVSNVSHELKTPLTSIRMFAELMHDRPQPPEKQSQYLRIITVEAERLTRLINNVLDFAKIGRKQKRIEKKPVDLYEVISRGWESQELHLREAGFTTRWEAAPGPYLLLGDDDALAQLLVNLLSNAEKYSTGRKEVELHTWIEDGWVNVSVLDRGMGVPNGEERKIFESFYRAHDSLSSGIQGSGLGLTLARRVAHEHGGEIKFERRDGGGSRFTLRLPIHDQAAAESVENTLMK